MVTQGIGAWQPVMKFIGLEDGEPVLRRGFTERSEDQCRTRSLRLNV